MSLDEEPDGFSPEVPLLSEAEELFELARFTITSLFRIAIMIRKSTSTDRFAKASLSRYAQSDPSFEIKHVLEKFPLLSNANKDWLSTRLGVANSQRRGYLSYVRDHQRKLELPPEISGTNNEEDTSTIQMTAASTFLNPTTTATEPPSDDKSSEASSALSSLGSRDDSYTYPPTLAVISNGSIEFECPLCHLIQRNLTEKTWQKHLYRDLRPYVCTFEDCDLKLFPDPASWMAHEAAYHRSRRQCPLCTGEESFDIANLRTHIQLHLPSATNDQIESLSEAARHVQHVYLASECPFCDSWEVKLRDSGNETVSDGPIQVTSSQYKRHVGSHMRQLALFVVPREYMRLDEDSTAESETDVGANAHSDDEEPSLLSSVDRIHQETLSSSLQQGDREASGSLIHESDSSKTTFMCPVRVREQDRGDSEFSCETSTFNNLAEVRRHMKRARHVSFLELCPTCNEHVVDKTAFEMWHGRNCNKPYITAIGPKGKEKQWQQLYDSINPKTTNEITSQTTPLATGHDPSRGTNPDADTEANMEKVWDKHTSDDPAQLHDKRPENPP
ncbi:uncharacterized protein N0V89_008152 [Didymosphaeria variabile]|uniref:C2H2-type domain-containing protein n=1 Tax=Didymosphaeria variabile TaxID=1932322 RepID=A0A9W9C890_9PLEO|nr:uncharacterized protein N0V89_008152 [Didymosphaeria variabile]KAJ4349536.1 hypothetical protein N0V89_008152 [Didymosphaeria variabile]